MYTFDMLHSWRRCTTAFLIVAASGCALPAQQPMQPSPPTVELRGAQWFNGRTFVATTRWMRAGMFIDRPTLRADSVVDLRGQWMIPPFGDAHTHSPDGEYGFDSIRDMYLRLGVFYVQTLANSRTGRAEVATRVNIPTSIDVAFANWAVTSTGGHPHVLYELLNLYRRPYSDDLSERLRAARSRARDGDTYVRLDSLPQLAPIIARMQRDTLPILKVMVLDAEHWAERHLDSMSVGHYGVNPALLPPLVDAAHALGRKVWAHVETPYDMALSLRAGVDAFAHVPGYGAANESDSIARTLLIPDSTIRLAGARHVLMTATLGIGASMVDADSTTRRRYREITVRNARALRRAGVTLLAGSDTYSSAEAVTGDPAATVRELGLSPLEFLRLWAVDTPTAIFPRRRIGRLSAGFEASALALSCNPLRDAACLSSISRRLKQGAWLTVQPAPK
jgi:imidazolonepropionase-like amidohydrolase